MHFGCRLLLCARLEACVCVGSGICGFGCIRCLSDIAVLGRSFGCARLRNTISKRPGGCLKDIFLKKTVSLRMDGFLEGY